MGAKTRSRRKFLAASVTGLNAAWVAANYPAILSAQKQVQDALNSGQTPQLTFFNAAQMKEVEAIVARIIPADDSPGAKEAHCHYFIDRALSTLARASQPAYTQGLQDLQARVQQLYPNAGTFSALTPDQQISTLTAIEKTPFFNLIRNHTVIGFLARPVHGGNYEKAGWKLIGYDDSLNHKPPFGYYDAQPPRQA